MNKLYKKNLTLIKSKVESEDGQRNFLYSNKGVNRCPSLGFNNDEESEEALLDCFASILVEAFLEQKQNEFKRKQEKSCNLLQGFNEGTS